MHSYRIRYSKEDAARFMSHLDLVRTFERALRRAGLPVSLSQGFNPHSRLAFGYPLPVGVAGKEEYADIVLDREVDPAQIVQSLNSAMPRGLKITAACPLKEGAPALMADVERASYRVRLGREGALGLDTVKQCLEKITAMTGVVVTRRKKDGSPALFDIRPGILSLGACREEGRVILEMDLMTGSSLNIRPGEVIQALRELCGIPGPGCSPDITRTRVLGKGGKELFDHCSVRPEKC